jgi:hypothetical protein
MKADVDGGIRKLLKSMYGDEIDEKIEAKFAEMRKAIEHEPRGIESVSAGLRESKERLARLESAVSRVESSLQKIESSGKEKMLSVVRKEIENISSEVKEESGKNRDRIEDVHSQLAGIREIFSEMRGISESLKTVDVRGIARDLESLKQKIEWFEKSQTVEDEDSLSDRLMEIEAQIKAMKFNSPLVIE